MYARHDPMDMFRLDLAHKIVSHGFAVVGVGYGDCSIPGCDCAPEPHPWSYTIGCDRLGHPEVVCMGYCQGHAHSLITTVIDEHRSGRPFVVDDLDGRRVGDLRYAVRSVPDEWVATDPDRIGTWIDYYAPGRETLELPRFVQAFVVDDDGLLPWERTDRNHVPVLADDPFAHPPVRRR